MSATAPRTTWTDNPDEPHGLLFGTDDTRIQPCRGGYEWCSFSMLGWEPTLNGAKKQAMAALRQQLRTPGGWIPAWIPLRGEER